MAGKDKELAAIGSIIDLLKPLDATARSRVIEYVLQRLKMGAVQAVASQSDSSGRTTSVPVVRDIRTLTAEKQPRSANDMVALIAYYLSELAPETDRSQTVNVELVRKYFKMAGFPMPRAPNSALPNSAAAGYLENVNRGEYRLNPVGYNLVVHGLPRSSAPGASGIIRRQINVRAAGSNGASQWPVARLVSLLRHLPSD
jgi:hypothetical protein